MNDSIYNRLPDWIEPLEFSFIFSGPEEFAAKMSYIAELPDLAALYQVLALKYSSATTRYLEEVPFVIALHRQLQVRWPVYLKQKDLLDRAMELDIAEVLKQQSKKAQTGRTFTDSRQDEGTQESEASGRNKNLVNTVENMDEPIVNASTVAVDNLSTRQESGNSETNDSATGSHTLKSNGQGSEEIGFTESVDGNMLDALMTKYDKINRDYVSSIYNAVDGLFKVIL